MGGQRMSWVIIRKPPSICSLRSFRCHRTLSSSASSASSSASLWGQAGITISPLPAPHSSASSFSSIAPHLPVCSSASSFTISSHFRLSSSITSISSVSSHLSLSPFSSSSSFSSIPHNPEPPSFISSVPSHRSISHAPSISSSSALPLSSSFSAISAHFPASPSSSFASPFHLALSASFSSSTSSKPSGRKGDECEGSPEGESASSAGKEEKSAEAPPNSEGQPGHLSPEKRGHWRLMGSAEKGSASIPVLSTVSKLGDEAGEASIGQRPVSMWPGMYHSPVTAALWAARTSILERAMDAPRDGNPQRELLLRTPSQSRTSILYSFANDKILQEQYRNPWDGIRIGKLLEDLDALAGTIAVKHCADDDHTTRPLMLVTASVDKISLFKPLNIIDDLTIAGAVAWVGRSSMEIRMEVCQLSPSEEEEKEDPVGLIANFTFVARDSISKKAAQINRLRPETEEEKKLFQDGETRDAVRKHQRGGTSEVSKAAKVVQDDLRLKALLTEGRVLREMPTLADRNVILMKDTKLENAIICQPQQRNMHGRIFGGFLMRRAYELAYSTCYVFCGSKPVFVEVDHVDFLRPVDVGDLLRFKSCVLYTEKDTQLMHIEVTAHVTQPELRTSEVSNTFYFTFTVDEDLLREGAPPIFRVVPGLTEEARRVLARYDAENDAKYPLIEKQLSMKALK